jgi:hypothetical protein
VERAGLAKDLGIACVRLLTIQTLHLPWYGDKGDDYVCIGCPNVIQKPLMSRMMNSRMP